MAKSRAGTKSGSGGAASAARSKPSAIKTQPTDASVDACIASRATGGQEADCRALIAIMQRVTKCAPKMWGPSIVGFGSYHYRYDSGREGDMCVTGFAIRQKELVAYLSLEGASQKALLKKLGRHRVTKACLYFSRLADLDADVLENLVAGSVAEIRRRYG